MVREKGKIPKTMWPATFLKSTRSARWSNSGLYPPSWQGLDTRANVTRKSKGSPEGAKLRCVVTEAASVFHFTILCRIGFRHRRFLVQVEIEVFERDFEEVRAVEGA